MAYPSMQDPAILLPAMQPSLFSGPTPFSGNLPARNLMFDGGNLPLIGGTAAGNMLAAGVISPLITAVAEKAGFPLIQFNGQGSLLNRIEARSYFAESRSAIKAAQEAERDQLTKQLVGIAALRGTPSDQATFASARALAGDLSTIGAYFGDTMPQTYDALFGVRGSPTMMARRMHMAGRYMDDPLSGKFGMSGEMAGELAQATYRRLYDTTENAVFGMRGVGAGSAGQMFDEMTRRGLLGGTQKETMERANQIAAITGDRSGQVARQEVSKAESQRYAKALQDMSGAVSAMRDIFGDAGNPDAPMSEIFEGLRALTQGNFARMNPGELEGLVRRTQETARMSGIPVQRLMAAMQEGGAQARSMGLNAQVGQEAVLSSVNFSQAFGSRFGDVKAIGGLTKEQAMAADTQLRNQAAESTVGQQLAATMRIFDQNFGGKLENIKDKDLQSMVKAIKERKTTYTDSEGKEQSVYMDEQQWLERMSKETGYSSDTVLQARQATKSNEGAALKYRTADTTRKLQVKDVMNMLHQPISKAVGLLGLGAEEVGEMTTKMQTAIREVDSSKVGEDGTLIQEIASKMRTAAPNLTEAKAKEMATSVWDSMNLNPLILNSVYGSATGVFQMQDKRVQEDTERLNMIARRRAKLSESLAGVGRAGYLRNVRDTLTDAKPGEKIEKTVGRMFGGVLPEELQKSLVEFGNKMKEFENGGGSPEAYEEFIRKLPGLNDKLDNLLTPIQIRAIETLRKTPEGKMAETTAEGIGEAVMGKAPFTLLMKAIGRRGPTTAPDGTDVAPPGVLETLLEKTLSIGKKPTKGPLTGDKSPLAPDKSPLAPDKSPKGPAPWQDTIGSIIDAFMPGRRRAADDRTDPTRVVDAKPLPADKERAGSGSEPGKAGRDGKLTLTGPIAITGELTLVGGGGTGKIDASSSGHRIPLSPPTEVT